MLASDLQQIEVKTLRSSAPFLFLSHFEVICDLLMNRRTLTWNLFVKMNRLQTEHCQVLSFSPSCPRGDSKVNGKETLVGKN